jgi:hypothetical protein
LALVAPWRFTVRGLMLVVAIACLPIGGSLEFVRLRRLSHQYAEPVINARQRLGY